MKQTYNEPDSEVIVLNVSGNIMENMGVSRTGKPSEGEAKQNPFGGEDRDASMGIWSDNDDI